jgi:site-specific DNA-methyltransferase (adenine-specific)
MGHHFQEGDVPSYQLFHGDCLVEMDKIPDGSVDMVFADLPYGMTDLGWDSVIPIDKMWKRIQEIGKSNCLYVFTASQPFTSVLVTSNIKMFKVEWIWQKNAGSNFATTKWYPMREHESVVVFGKGQTTYNPIMQKRSAPIKAGYVNTSNTGKRLAYSGVTNNKGFTVKDGDMRVPSSVQKFNRQRGLHPNQKPEALIEYLITTYSNAGETVMDFCMGSGTAGVSSAKMGRNFIGIELYPFLDRPIDKKTNPNYFFEAEERIQKAYAQYQSPIP